MKKTLLTTLLTVGLCSGAFADTMPALNIQPSLLPSPTKIIVENKTNLFTGFVTLAGPDVLATGVLTPYVPYNFTAPRTFPGSNYRMFVSLVNPLTGEGGMVACHGRVGDPKSASFHTSFRNSGTYEVDIIKASQIGAQSNLECVYKNLTPKPPKTKNGHE